MAPILGKAEPRDDVAVGDERRLTDGKLHGHFFRVVPHDGVQGPTDADFMIEKLEAKKVLIVDDQSAYSTGLRRQGRQRAQGRRCRRSTAESISQKTTDFSALVTKIDADADVVFLPWQLAAHAQLFAQADEGAGQDGRRSSARDGMFWPKDFNVERALRVVVRARRRRRSRRSQRRWRSLQQGAYRRVRHVRPSDLRAAQVVLEAANDGVRRRQDRRAEVARGREDVKLDDVRSSAGRSSSRERRRRGREVLRVHRSRTAST